MSKESNHIVIGHFSKPELATAALSELKGAGHDQNVRYFSPIPEHHMEDALYEGRKRSPVRRCTFFGGLTGCLAAFLFTSWMSIDYPIRVSAKPLVSIPAFIVIAFECTILLGAISTLLGMFHFSRLPNIFSTSGFKPNFTEGTFGVVVQLPKDETDKCKSDMKSWGADKVEVEYTR